jgi:hypothetical protein
VVEQTAWGWDAAEIERQHPYLSRAHIEAALAFYREHRDELDQDIEGRRQRVETMRRATGQAALARRLKMTGQR